MRRVVRRAERRRDGRQLVVGQILHVAAADIERVVPDVGERPHAARARKVLGSDRQIEHNIVPDQDAAFRKVEEILERGARRAAVFRQESVGEAVDPLGRADRPRRTQEPFETRGFAAAGREADGRDLYDIVRVNVGAGAFHIEYDDASVVKRLQQTDEKVAAAVRAQIGQIAWERAAVRARQGRQRARRRFADAGCMAAQQAQKRRAVARIGKQADTGERVLYLGA